MTTAGRLAFREGSLESGREHGELVGEELGLLAEPSGPTSVAHKMFAGRDGTLEVAAKLLLNISKPLCLRLLKGA